MSAGRPKIAMRNGVSALRLTFSAIVLERMIDELPTQSWLRRFMRREVQQPESESDLQYWPPILERLLWRDCVGFSACVLMFVGQV